MEDFDALLAIQEEKMGQMGKKKTIKVTKCSNCYFFPVSSDSSCATMAKKTLVHRSFTDAYRLPKTTSSKRGSLSSTKVKDIPSGSKSFESEGMASIKRNFKETELENCYHGEKEIKSTVCSVVGVINGIIQYLLLIVQIF